MRALCLDGGSFFGKFCVQTSNKDFWHINTTKCQKFWAHLHTIKNKILPHIISQRRCHVRRKFHPGHKCLIAVVPFHLLGFDWLIIGRMNMKLYVCGEMTSPLSREHHLVVWSVMSFVCGRLFQWESSSKIPTNQSLLI